MGWQNHYLLLPATETTIYAFGIASPASPASALINGNNFYGIGIDPQTNIIYVGIAPSFQSEATVLRHPIIPMGS